MKVEKTHERQNRFSGESIMLTREEAKKHDAIFYYEYLATLEDKKVGIDGYSKLWDKVRKGIDWFRQNNAEAYYGITRLTATLCTMATASPLCYY
jgi:hypothetical protein